MKQVYLLIVAAFFSAVLISAQDNKPAEPIFNQNPEKAEIVVSDLAFFWRAFVPKTTDSKDAFGFSPNLLKDQSNENLGQGLCLVGDITYLPLQNGRFCYLATFQDKYTRRIVGW